MLTLNTFFEKIKNFKNDILGLKPDVN